MDPFACMHDYYEAIGNNDQAQLDEAFENIDKLKQEPLFSETLLNYIINSENDENYQLFLATQIIRQVKDYWENDQLYSDKEEFRTNLLEIMFKSTGPFLSNISEIISLISQSDFPDKWPNLMTSLTEALDGADLQVIYSILYTTTQIFKRYEKMASSDPIIREIENVVQCWGDTLVALLDEVLPAQPECDELEECFNFCFQIIKSLCSYDLPKYINANLDKFFSFYHSFFVLDGCIAIKITLCQIMRQYIVRYLHEIANWGKSEDDKRTEEEIQNVKDLWSELKNDLINTLGQNINEEDANQLVIASFDALTLLARSPEKDFFIQDDNLQNFCINALIPCVQISDDDINDFENDSLHYFQHDIEGLESESRRISARNFLKILGRTFKSELTSVFDDICQQILASFNQNPDESWKDLDTSMFIMSIILAKINRYNWGVKELIDDCDLTDFLNTYIIPHLDGQYPLLQADALKFLVEYRFVTDPSVIVELFPEVVNLLSNEQSPVALYATYFIERILDCKIYKEDPEIGGALFENVDVSLLVQQLIKLFNFENKANLISARCLMRLVMFLKENINEQIGHIVSTCVTALTNICPKDTKNPLFNHYLFEVIVASVTKAKVPVPEIQDEVLKLLGIIIDEDVTEFVPYVYQIIACFLYNYPEEVLESDSESFYVTQFPTFLEEERWMAMGNIPALALLVQAYCIRLRDLVESNIEQILTMCEHLLTGPRSHPSAFLIFYSIVRFLPHDFTFSILPQIYGLIISQLSNQDLKKYRQTFAVFMSNCCFFLEPDDAINLLGEDAEGAISCWAESLPLVRGRSELECAITGSINALLNSTVLSQASWEQLFLGTVRMIELPSNKTSKEDIDVIKQEEEDAKQFDSTFSKLLNAEAKEIDPHPEMNGVNIVKYMAESFAEYSQQHPGQLAEILENAEPQLRNAFMSYQNRFEITFA